MPMSGAYYAAGVSEEFGAINYPGAATGKHSSFISGCTIFGYLAGLQPGEPKANLR